MPLNNLLLPDLNSYIEDAVKSFDSIPEERTIVFSLISK